MVSRTTDNLPARRRRKRRAAPSLRLTVLMVVLVLIVAAAGALMAPGLNVVEVYCEGNVNISSEELIAVSQIETGRNILLARVGKAEREVKKLPFADDAEVKRVLPNKICIRVTERVPAAYVRAGTEGVMLDTAGIILKKIEPSLLEQLALAYTPDPTPEITDKDKKSDKDESEEADESEEEQPPGEEAEEQSAVLPEGLHSIPLVEGIELKNSDEGKQARCDDEERLKILIEICTALNDSGLLNRATYLDITESSDIRLVVENRLDIQLGSTNNIAYRAKFLTEVINTRISAYEKAVMDYRGDDIYVRAPEDGKARTIPKTDEEESDEEETDENDEENSDEDSDGEETTDESSDEEETSADENDVHIGEI